MPQRLKPTKWSMALVEAFPNRSQRSRRTCCSWRQGRQGPSFVRSLGKSPGLTPEGHIAVTPRRWCVARLYDARNQHDQDLSL